MSGSQQIIEDEESQGVALVAASLFPTKPWATQYGSHLQIGAIFSLTENLGRLKKFLPYRTAIGDLEISLEEISPHPQGYTHFEIREDHQILAHGNNKIENLLKSILASLVKSAILCAASSLQPYFGALVHALFVAIGKNRHAAKKGDRTLKTRYFRRWSFVIWQKKPGAIVQDIEAGLFASMQPSLPHAQFDMSGQVQYQLTVSAKTGDVRFLGPVNTISVVETGIISKQIPFTLDWQ